jgi:NAD-dependent dihydropyrimidine dehydrogenase PreA subunit
MPWVVTRLCRDNVDTACVAECPVDCFYIPKDTSNGRNQLVISPSECIDCGACEPACPWEAIFKDDSVPSRLADDIALNAEVDARRDEFEQAQENPDTPKPTAEEIQANRAKWGV